MKKLLFTICLLLGAISISAQTTQQGEDARTAELRHKIGIDYSMPDFNMSKIEGKVIGERLAKMLRLLQSNAKDPVYNQRLSSILCDQNDKLNFCTIDKFKISNVSKQGDVITIKMNASLMQNSYGIKNSDFCVVFNKGVADNQTANDFFSDLSRYIKD